MFHCRTPNTRLRSTTFSPPPRHRRIWPALTAFVTVIGPRIRRDLLDHYGRTRGEGFGPEVKRRIILGTYVLSSGYYDAYYLRAQKVRELIRQDFAQAFAKVDALISPTSPVPAFKLGERTADPLQMYLADIFTGAANLAGICAISLPCGFAQSDDGIHISDWTAIARPGAR